MTTTKPRRGLTRREFMKTSALVGGAGAAATMFQVFGRPAVASSGQVASDYILASPENVLYSTCLQCHVACQIKAKTWDGVLAKVSGNPYSPQNYLPHLDFETSPFDAATADGKLCPAGQSGIQTYADPYRVRRVLKRAGPRGSNKWRAIPFAQFVDEVVAGGKLFNDIGDDRDYPGFDEVFALRDAEVSKKLAGDVGKVMSGEMTVTEFKSTNAAHLDVLIDPDHPDFGPKNNQFVFQAGRIEHGRKELGKGWFTKAGFGSINEYDHTTICEQSHHIAHGEMSGGKTHHLKPDMENTEFVLFWGTGAFTANFGKTPMAEKVTTGKVDRGLKTAVVDPRLSHDAGRADWWLPIKPGTDGALALGMAGWMFANERYDAAYLANANKAAAAVSGETTWTNAAYLVRVENGRGAALLDAAEAGVGEAGQAVVMSGGGPVAVTPGDEENAVVGDLFVDTRVAGIAVKSALMLFRDEALSRSLDEVADITQVPKRLIETVAAELTSHGKKAVVEMYRGPVQHTDGYYAGTAIIMLNVLLGNADWKGGWQKGGGHWHESGGKDGSVYNFGDMDPGALKAFGIRIARDKVAYEKTTLFASDGYPAKRPFFPFTSNVYQEIIPSFASGYPYQGKILMVHKGTPALASPAGHTNIEMLQDPDRVPLFISCDVVIGETTLYADYVLPDLTFLERWGTPHPPPDIVTKTSKVRQPVAVPLTEEVEVDGELMPISMESFMIAVAKRLGMPGFGADGFGPGMAFDRPEDWYLKLMANLAFGDGADEAVPDASPAEMELFSRARRFLPPSVFDEARWRRALRPEEWPKVVYVLNRGGRFAAYGSGWDGDHMKSRLGTMFHVFVERVAAAKHSVTGKPFSGTPVWRGQRDSADDPVDQSGAYPLSLITYKEPWGGQSRTITNYWSNIGLKPTNSVLMNRRDAERLGLEDGHKVRLQSATNPEGRFNLGNGETFDVVAPLEVVEGILPGTVAASWHYGHWAYGAADCEIDGETVKGEKRRGAGVCPNPVMLIDPKLGDVCMTDPIGGSSSFYDTMVAVVRA
ncbi:MAG: molybdopterin-dependent oxidoreductase [Acidimicrobiia bacterium]